jgi:hypothetical protein
MLVFAVPDTACFDGLCGDSAVRGGLGDTLEDIWGRSPPSFVASLAET